MSRSSAVPRPGPLLWCWHALGGKLPQRYHEWALRDATCRTWWLRNLAALLVRLILPAGALFAVLASFSGPLWLAFLSVLLGLIVAVYYGLTYAVDSVDSRLSRYGYPPRTASRLRAQANEQQHREREREYERLWRAPRDDSEQPGEHERR